MLFSHIISGKKAELYRTDDPDWVPSVGLRGQKGGSRESTRDSMNSRYKRRMIRTQQKQKAAAAAAGVSFAANDVDMINDDPSTSYDLSNHFCCKGTQTELTCDVIEAMTA